MELYDAIFYRKSTRKYSNKKVKEGLLEEVIDLIDDGRKMAVYVHKLPI